MLKWKPPREYKSITYNQSGFELKNTSDQTVLWLSQIGNIPIHFHREIPNDANIKQVTIKQESNGEWYATFGIECENSQTKPKNPNKCVGIDVGILKYVHDTDGTAVESLDLSDERERLAREQQKLSRKEHGSNNWEKQRQKVAECHQRIKQKRQDFLHKLSDYYATEYELVAVEDLDVKNMMKSPRNSRNTASSAWNTFTDMLEYKCEREGTHFVEVAPEGTTKECAKCSVETDKPLWVREHSCPSCGFEVDRDANAALNILSRGLSKLGVVHSEGTPVETATAVGDDSFESVSASCVVESGSPNLNEQAKASE
jgi:putative transposase